MYNTCKRQHYYRFGLGIEPTFWNLGMALQRGIIGHEALDAYYTLMKQGYSVDDCKEAAFDVLKQWTAKIVTEAPEQLDLFKMIAHLTELIEVYAEVYRVEPFKVLETEGFFKTSLNNEHHYGMRLDLLVEFTSGKYRGDFAVMDHKFLYNFKSDKELKMDGQLPKYVKTVRDNGYTITKGIFNQIRWRSLKAATTEDIFKREILTSTVVETDRIWKEQTRASNEIAEYKAMPVKEFADKAVRNLSPFITCKYCYFSDICKTELEGRDITPAISANFQPNTYGYLDMAEV